MQQLRFLEFERSEDSEGLRTWDALASPTAVHALALLTEVQALVHHLSQQLGPAGPVDHGHLWDMDLQVNDGTGQDLPLQTSPPPGCRITVALSLSGGAALAEGLLAWGVG